MAAAPDTASALFRLVSVNVPALKQRLAASLVLLVVAALAGVFLLAALSGALILWMTQSVGVLNALLIYAVLMLVVILAAWGIHMLIVRHYRRKAEIAARARAARLASSLALIRQVLPLLSVGKKKEHKTNGTEGSSSSGGLGTTALIFPLIAAGVFLALSKLGNDDG